MKNKRGQVQRRSTLQNWSVLFRIALCALIFRGHKFPSNLGKRSDLVCQRCGVIFFTEKAYRKGKR